MVKAATVSAQIRGAGETDATSCWGWFVAPSVTVSAVSPLARGNGALAVASAGLCVPAGETVPPLGTRTSQGLRRGAGKRLSAGEVLEVGVEAAGRVLGFWTHISQPLGPERHATYRCGA